jgi:hypothetical protein
VESLPAICSTIESPISLLGIRNVWREPALAKTRKKKIRPILQSIRSKNTSIESK